MMYYAARELPGLLTVFGTYSGTMKVMAPIRLTKSSCSIQQNKEVTANDRNQLPG